MNVPINDKWVITNDRIYNSTCRNCESNLKESFFNGSYLVVKPIHKVQGRHKIYCINCAIQIFKLNPNEFKIELVA